MADFGIGESIALSEAAEVGVGAAAEAGAVGAGEIGAAEFGAAEVGAFEGFGAEAGAAGFSLDASELSLLEEEIAAGVSGTIVGSPTGIAGEIELQAPGSYSFGGGGGEGGGGADLTGTTPGKYFDPWGGWAPPDPVSPETAVAGDPGGTAGIGGVGADPGGFTGAAEAVPAGDALAGAVAGGAGEVSPEAAASSGFVAADPGGTASTLGLGVGGDPGGFASLLGESGSFGDAIANSAQFSALDAGGGEGGPFAFGGGGGSISELEGLGTLPLENTSLDIGELGSGDVAGGTSNGFPFGELRQSLQSVDGVASTEGPGFFEGLFNDTKALGSSAIDKITGYVEKNPIQAGLAALSVASFLGGGTNPLAARAAGGGITAVPGGKETTQAATKAAQVADQQLTNFQNQTLTPGQQSQLDQWRQDRMNEVNNYFARSNQSGSTMHIQATQFIQGQYEQLKQKMIDSSLTNGLSALGAASKEVTTAANFQLQQDANFQAALGNATRSIGYLAGNAPRLVQVAA